MSMGVDAYQCTALVTAVAALDTLMAAHPIPDLIRARGRSIAEQ
jgi:hypothetical protein